MQEETRRMCTNIGHADETEGIHSAPCEAGHGTTDNANDATFR
jgi:hypothetical protein